MRNDSQYCDSELNHLREQLDNQRAEVENFPEGDDYLTDREESSQEKVSIRVFLVKD